MCKLCDKIYRCTESLPELEDCIQVCPEGVIHLKTVRYDSVLDNFYHLWTISINFCPECGRDLYK